MPARNEIMAAIGQTNSPDTKAILLLLLGVLEEIGDKIDAMRKDEQGLRDAVLNGHSKSHDSHHEWIEKRMAEELEAEKAKKDSVRKIRDTIIEKIIWVALIAAAGSGWILR